MMDLGINMADGPVDRRRFLKQGTVAAAGAAVSRGVPWSDAASRPYQHGSSPWPISLDTSTIRPASTLEAKIDIAAEAGYDGIEPWEGELQTYEENGGNLETLGRSIADRGLSVPNVIALWNAIPPTQDEWEAVQSDHRRRFRQASEVGATYIQTVLTPDRSWDEYNLYWAADRYRDLIEMGINEYAVRPALNFLQFLPHIQQIGQAAAIALNADHPEARIIPDTFHLYAGGSGWSGLQHLRGDFLAAFQINDVPADPPREQLEDEHRIYPGDGILPLEDILQTLHDIGYRRDITLQLFNPQYWEQDLLTVARTGLHKTVAVIERALA